MRQEKMNPNTERVASAAEDAQLNDGLVALLLAYLISLPSWC